MSTYVSSQIKFILFLCQFTVIHNDTHHPSTCVDCHHCPSPRPAKVHGVKLKGELAGQSENDTIHTDELYRSSLNLVSSCRSTQFDMLHSQKMVMWTTIMFSAHFFHCMGHDSPQMDQICSLDDNLVRFGGKSDCSAIKM